MTKNTTVFYEWDVEEVTDVESERYEEGEVIEHWHQESYADCQHLTAQKAPSGMRFEIVLVCNTFDDRSWAYVENGKLPKYFENAYQNKTRKVPKRFHDELAKAKLT